MNQREAKRLVCDMAWRLLYASRHSFDSDFWFYDKQGNRRSDEDIERIEKAVEELLIELDRRAGYPDLELGD